MNEWLIGGIVIPSNSARPFPVTVSSMVSHLKFSFLKKKMGKLDGSKVHSSLESLRIKKKEILKIKRQSSLGITGTK